MGEKEGEKLGEKVGEKTGKKVGESLGEIHKLNLCRRGCSINSLVINSLIDSVTDPFPPDLQNNINHKR